MSSYDIDPILSIEAEVEKIRKKLEKASSDNEIAELNEKLKFIRDKLKSKIHDMNKIRQNMHNTLINMEQKYTNIDSTDEISQVLSRMISFRNQLDEIADILKWFKDQLKFVESEIHILEADMLEVNCRLHIHHKQTEKLYNDMTLLSREISYEKNKYNEMKETKNKLWDKAQKLVKFA